MDLEADLRKEIKKWSARLDKEMESVRETGKNRDFLKNIRAYVKDSEYFEDKGDLIRSFEALIWAWAYLEILRELGLA